MELHFGTWKWVLLQNGFSFVTKDWTGIIENMTNSLTFLPRKSPSANFSFTWFCQYQCLPHVLLLPTPTGDIRREWTTMCFT